MRKRTLLHAASLGVLAVVAGVILATPGSAEQASDARLDKLHSVRPIAASPHVFGAAPAVAGLHEAFAFVASVQAHEIGTFVADVQAHEIGTFVADVQAREIGKLLAAEEARARAAVVRRAPTAPRPSTGGDALACIRHRESHGDYSARSSGGLYHGAYQFLQSTWDATAASAGRSDLVGVDPASASPADQDAMASTLYAQRGSQPWGGTC